MHQCALKMHQCALMHLDSIGSSMSLLIAVAAAAAAATAVEQRHFDTRMAALSRATIPSIRKHPTTTAAARHSTQAEVLRCSASIYYGPILQ
jgi:hypothetical protein